MVTDPLPPLTDSEWAVIQQTSTALKRSHARERRGLMSAQGTDRPSTLLFRRGDEITPERVDWLWPGRIARGKLTVIAGHPGTGKSQITADLIARVTQGARWPVDGAHAPRGAAVVLSAEDDAADTLIPRLIAAQADLARVHLVEAVHTLSAEGRSSTRGVDLGRDVAALADLLDSLNDVAIIVIDPITAYLGRTDSHINAEVRGLLMPLAQLAEHYRVALIAVTHLRKSAGSEALLAVTGSLGFVAAARAAYLVVKDATDPQRRLWLPAKNNLGPDLAGLAYRVVACDIGHGITTSRIEWEHQAVAITADDALVAHTAAAETERDAAAEWLSELLARGPVLAKEVQSEAKAAGFAWATLRRAKQHLGVTVKRDGFGKGGAWQWQLPTPLATPVDGIDAIGAQRETMSPYAFYEDREHLCDPIGAHQQSIECIDAHPLAPEHLRQVCRRCDGEGCRWCE